MKKFVIKLLFFFVCVMIMDFAFGHFFSYLRVHAKGGSTANCEYIANSATEDIIILGSSRATHHYVPQIIEDSLGVSCYNCGEEGNGVILAYGRLKMLMNRYTPKLVIYEITPGYDYGVNEPNNRYLSYLRPYYSKSIKELFDTFDDEFSSFKMKSKMYQNTSRLLPNIVDNLIFRNNRKGYEPLYGKIDVLNSQSKKSIQRDNKSFEVDSLKYRYLQSVVELCKVKGSRLIFMISPRYGNVDQFLSDCEPAFNLCKNNSVDLRNNINIPSISQRAEFFQDNGHLNYRGAIAYTQYLIPIIRNVIQ